MKDHDLLNKIRSFNRTFIRADKYMPDLIEATRAVAEMCGSLLIVVDSEGTVLAGEQGEAKPEARLEKLLKEGSLAEDPGYYKLIKSKETLFNQSYPGESGGDNFYIVVPISAGGKYFAALLLCQSGGPYDTESLVLAEIGALLIAMIIQQTATNREEEYTRNRELAEGAFESLSYSEVEAIREILKNITNNESVIVASKIADSLGITRSVIVNALRKFESAGIIESRSLGMKGTFIRVKNLHALEIIASRSDKISFLR